MYFKRLGIVGFKSFCNKTVFEFEPGMTAIVGPNGCGKSNIADAIRWVLGEQSPKSLRGKGMIDVIFNGTADSQPLGMAEVVLTISDVKKALDIDYDEVSVGRRLFRSGESQYLINRQPCRLRDVQELFMNTGVGVDAYSIIEQGKIDMILSNKPEERRYLFEEAAGITKYKADKKAALRKLENTEDNLARVNDIISEVKRQINSLKRHAGKARRYKELVEKLSQLEIAFLLHNRQKTQAELELIKNRQQGLRKEIDEFSGEVEEEEEAIQKLRLQLQEHERTYEMFQGKKLDLLREVDRQENNVSLCDQRTADIGNSRENHLRQIDVLAEQIRNLEGEITDREAELEQLRAENDRFKTELTGEEEQFSTMKTDIESEEKNTHEINQQIMTLVERRMDLKNRIAGLEERAEEASRRLERLQGRLQENRRKLEELSHQESAIMAEKAQIEEQIRELNLQHEQGQDLIGGKSGKRDTARDEMLTIHKGLSETGSQLELLRQMKQRYEGYDAGVQSILRESKGDSGGIKGVLRTVAEGLKVQSGFEIAIEAALDRFVQCVILESEQHLMQAVQWLKDAGKGKATLAVLSKPAPDSATETAAELPKEPGVHGWASKYVESDPPLPAYLLEILKNTIVVKNLELGFRLVREGYRNFNVVTVAGDIIHRGELVTAGAPIDGKTGLIMRDNRISELEIRMEKEKTELARIGQHQSALTEELEKAESEMKTVAARLAEENNRLTEKGAAHLNTGV